MAIATRQRSNASANSAQEDQRRLTPEPKSHRDIHLVQVLGDETLRTIAWQLVRTVRNNVTIDWTLWENMCAHRHPSATLVPVPRTPG